MKLLLYHFTWIDSPHYSNLIWFYHFAHMSFRWRRWYVTSWRGSSCCLTGPGRWHCDWACMPPPTPTHCHPPPTQASPTPAFQTSMRAPSSTPSSGRYRTATRWPPTWHWSWANTDTGKTIFWLNIYWLISNLVDLAFTAINPTLLTSLIDLEFFY